MLIRSFVVAAGFALLPWHTADAQTVRTWNVTSGTWNTAGNWGGTAPTASDTAYFSGATVGSSDATVLLPTGTSSVLGLSFNNAGATTLRSNAGTARTLAIGTGGIAMNSGAGAVTIGVTGSMVNLILNGTQTFTNNSSSLLSIVGTVNTAGTVGSDLTIAGSGSTTISNSITGGAGRVISVRKQGAGVLTLSGAASNYTGGFTLDDGTVVVGNDAALGTGKLTIAGGAVDVTGARVTTNNNAQDWNGDFTFVGTNTLNLGTGVVAMNASRTVTVNASTLTVGGVISGASFGITKAGAGNLTLGGANTFTGPVTINSGTLTVTSAIGNGGVAGALGQSTSDAANLVINGGVFNWNVNASGTSDRSITIGTNGGTILGNGNGNGVAVTLTGSLALAGSGPRTITLTSVLSGRSNSLSADIGDSGGATAVVVSNTTANGASSWALSGNLTFTGGLSMTGGGGQLNLTGTRNNFSGGVTVGAGSTLNVNATTTLSQDITNHGTIGMGANSTSVTFAGVISGSGSVDSSGNSRNLNLSNVNNSYEGTTSFASNLLTQYLTVTKLADGGLNSSIGKSSSVASNLLLRGASLRYTGTGDSTDRLFTINGSAAGDSAGIEANGTGPLGFTNTGNIAYGTTDQTRTLQLSGSNTGNNTFAPTIGDNGTAAVSFTKSGAGRWALTGNNTYTGTTTVSAGTLQIGNNGSTGAISNSSPVSVSSGATLAFNRSNAITYSGTVSGAGGLTKLGGGQLQLTAVNAYSGTTTVSAGRLLVDGAGNLQSTARVVVAGSDADFRWNSSTAFTRPLTMTQGTISGTGTISASGGVSIGTNAILSPGNSPGIQAYTTGLTWAGAGSYLWEINDWTGAAGTAYDQIAVSGSALDITATSGSKFTILITSLTGANASGSVPNFDGNTNKTFTIATSSAGITGFDASKFTLSTANFSNTNSGSWAIRADSSNVFLDYIAPGVSTTTGSYSLSASAGAATIIAGGSSTITATITNTGAGTADALNYGSLAVGQGVSISPASGSNLAQAASGTGTGVFTSAAPGVYSFAPTASVTNATLGGAAVLSGSTATSVTVLDHAMSSLAGLSVLTSSTISLGTWDYESQSWTQGSGTNLFSIFNLNPNLLDPSFVALLDLTGTSASGSSGFTLGAGLTPGSFAMIAGGTSASYSVSYDPTGMNTQGTFSRTFTFQMADQNLPGGQATNTLSVTAAVIVVPEPGAIALAGIGIAAAAYSLRRRTRC